MTSAKNLWFESIMFVDETFNVCKSVYLMWWEYFAAE